MQALHREPGTRARAALVVAIAAIAMLALLAGRRDRADAAATASRSVTVKMDHFEYTPRSLNVAKGTRVIFSNLSGVPHTATQRGSFTTGKIKPGRAVAVKFSAKGTYRYFCTIHPEMRGKVTVG